VFTSPSSVDSEAKATKRGNAELHGMTTVTHASIAYIAMQVHKQHLLERSWVNLGFKYKTWVALSTVRSFKAKNDT
jgi:hypothetical protein